VPSLFNLSKKSKYHGFIYEYVTYPLCISLPSLRTAVEKELHDCHAGIAQLPPVSNAHPSTEVMLRVTEFCKDVRDTVFGEKNKIFVQTNRTSYSSFKDAIIVTTPDFRPFEDIRSSYPLVSSNCQPRGLKDVRKVIKECVNRTRSSVLFLFLFCRSIAWELPRHVPFEATKTLVMEYITMWTNPTMVCFETIASHAEKFLQTLLQRHFGQYIHLVRYVRCVSLKYVSAGAHGTCTK